MADKIKVRILLAKFHDDDAPVALTAVDQTIWDHWDDEDEHLWRTNAKTLFGADPTDYELREAWGVFSTEDLMAAFNVPIAEAEVEIS